MEQNHDKLYINIGTPKACLFVHMSNKLLNQLRIFPFLYDAVEEALISFKDNYYSIGIIIWYELLYRVFNSNNRDDSERRNIVAHDILKIRPTKESYEKLLYRLKDEAKKVAQKNEPKQKIKKNI